MDEIVKCISVLLLRSERGWKGGREPGQWYPQSEFPCLAFAMSGTLEGVLEYVLFILHFGMSLGVKWRGASHKLSSLEDNVNHGSWSVPLGSTTLTVAHCFL